jgi:hypothetical protein
MVRWRRQTRDTDAYRCSEKDHVFVMRVKNVKPTELESKPTDRATVHWHVIRVCSVWKKRRVMCPEHIVFDKRYALVSRPILLVPFGQRALHFLGVRVWKIETHRFTSVDILRLGQRVSCNT